MIFTVIQGLSSKLKNQNLKLKLHEGSSVNPVMSKKANPSILLSVVAIALSVVLLVWKRNLAQQIKQVIRS